MIFKIKDKENIYEIDDLISFDKQSSGFREAFQKAIKENEFNNDIAEFDNAQVSIFDSNRVLITIKEIDNENI